jgi:hypothetical protein
MIGFTSVEKDFVPLQLTELVESLLLLQANKTPNTSATINALFRKINFDDVVLLRIPKI